MVLLKKLWQLAWSQTLLPKNSWQHNGPWDDDACVTHYLLWRRCDFESSNCWHVYILPVFLRSNFWFLGRGKHHDGKTSNLWWERSKEVSLKRSHFVRLKKEISHCDRMSGENPIIVSSTRCDYMKYVWTPSNNFLIQSKNTFCVLW